mgnify:FL=1
MSLAPTGPKVNVNQSVEVSISISTTASTIGYPFRFFWLVTTDPPDIEAENELADVLNTNPSALSITLLANTLQADLQYSLTAIIKNSYNYIGRDETISFNTVSIPDFSINGKKF